MKNTRLIILSLAEEPEIIVEALENGARGYIPTKSATIELVIEIIRLVKVGGIFVPRSSLSARTTSETREQHHEDISSRFTAREMAVLSLLKRGTANKKIAYDLKISESTVKNHIRSIMNKLKVKNRTAVVS